MTGATQRSLCSRGKLLRMRAEQRPSPGQFLDVRPRVT